MKIKSSKKSIILFVIILVIVLLWWFHVKLDDIEGFTNSNPYNSVKCDDVMNWINQDFNNRKKYCGNKGCNICAKSNGNGTSNAFIIDGNKCKYKLKTTCDSNNAYVWCGKDNPKDQTGGFKKC